MRKILDQVSEVLPKLNTFRARMSQVLLQRSSSGNLSVSLTFGYTQWEEEFCEKLRSQFRYLKMNGLCGFVFLHCSLGHFLGFSLGVNPLWPHCSGNIGETYMSFQEPFWKNTWSREISNLQSSWWELAFTENTALVAVFWKKQNISFQSYIFFFISRAVSKERSNSTGHCGICVLVIACLVACFWPLTDALPRFHWIWILDIIPNKKLSPIV